MEQGGIKRFSGKRDGCFYKA